MVFLPVIPAFGKTNRFHRYGLAIVSKDRNVYRKKLPLKLKSDTVEILKEVKRKMLTS